MGLSQQSMGHLNYFVK